MSSRPVFELEDYGTADYALMVAPFRVTTTEYAPGSLCYAIVNRVTGVIEAEGSVLGQAILAVRHYQTVLDEARIAIAAKPDDTNNPFVN